MLLSSALRLARKHGISFKRQFSSRVYTFDGKMVECEVPGSHRATQAFMQVEEILDTSWAVAVPIPNPDRFGFRTEWINQRAVADYLLKEISDAPHTPR